MKPLPKMLTGRPDLIGIVTMIVELPFVITLAERMKEKWHAPIIVGGPHCNAVGSDTLRECKALDFCCVGEGERLLIEVAGCLESDCGWEALRD